MDYISTRDNQEKVSFEMAAVKGLASKGGLYMPSFIPRLDPSFIDSILNKSDVEIGVEVLKEFVAPSLSIDQLETIVTETLSFPIPVIKLAKNISVLELFHGPTLAFKDVGARFMSRCLSLFSHEQEVTVLAATSGDTGSAVANGFYKVPGVKVKVLFPKGKVSPFQEFQMTSLGHNIEAIEVEGSFDDCQQLVKTAFQDASINKNLSSANSINIARLLPQMLYYFLAYKQLLTENQKIVVSVPSGNFGNITAGLIAKKMGLPIHRFIAACNANDAFYRYIKTGDYKKQATIPTYANAMDVGAPNNVARIFHLYENNYDHISSDISAATYSDAQILAEMKNCYTKNNYVLDPHGAIGKMALQDQLKENEQGLFLATAHPKKFESVVKKALPDYPEEKVELDGCKKQSIQNDYSQLHVLLSE